MENINMDKVKEFYVKQHNFFFQKQNNIIFYLYI